MNISLKHIIILFGGIFTCTFSFSQQVTLDDLMDNNVKSETTSSKKWVKEFDAATDITSARTILSIELIKLTKSKNWQSLSANGEITNELSFQTSKKMYVDRILVNLREAGFTLSNTKTSTDSKTYIYTKNNVTVEILALSTESTAQTVYLVTLL